MCRQNILLTLLLTFTLFCQGQPLVDFSDPLETITHVRNGKIQLKSQKKEQIRFPSCGIFLPQFHKGEIGLDISGITPYSKVPAFSAVIHDRNGRSFRFLLKESSRENGRIRISAIIDSAQAYPGIRNRKAEQAIPEQPLRVMMLEIQGEKSTLNLHSLNFFEHGVMPGLKTGHRIPVLDLNRKTIPELEVKNHGGKRAELSLAYSLTNSAGKETGSGKMHLVLGPGEKKCFPLKRPELQDVYTLRCTITEEDKTRAYRERMAVIRTFQRKEKSAGKRFPLGFCEHFQRYSKSDLEKMLEYLSFCGAEEIRLSWLWPQINPKRDIWDFQRTDWLVNQLNARGIGVLALLGATPKYAEATGYHRTNSKAALHLPKLELFEEWIRRFASHYNGKISKFCVWNEPDIAHFSDFAPEEYLKLQTSAYRILKSVNPDHTVIAGGFSHLFTPYSREVLEQMGKTAPESADLISTHLYMPTSRITENLANMRRFLDSQKLKQPLCTEETGEGTTNDHQQLVTLFQKVIRSRVAGLKLFHWYNLRNCGFDPGNREHNFGLLEHDLNPRAGFVTFHMLSALYGNAVFFRQESSWKNCFAARFESPDSALYAVWLEKRDQQKTLVQFESNAESIELIDLFGNVTKIHPEEGRFRILLDSNGQTLRLSPANAALKAPREVLAATEPLRIRPGEKKEFVFHCELSGNVVLEAIPGKHLSASPAIKGKNGEFRIPIQASREFRPEQSSTFKVRILQNGVKVGEPIEFPLSRIYYIQYGKMTRIGSLRHISQVRRMLPDTPEYGKLFWNDSRDCAVDFGATAGRDLLHFQISLYDDIHVQHFSAEELWKGDSIQLVLQFPGQKDYWELGIAMTEDGKFLKHIWKGPDGMDLAKALNGIRVHGRQSKNAHYFHLLLPLSLFGSSLEELRQKGVYFNLLANDNDAGIRESQLSFMGKEGTHPAERMTRESPLLMLDPAK